MYTVNGKIINLHTDYSFFFLNSNCSVHKVNLMWIKGLSYTFENMVCPFRGYRSAGLAPPHSSCAWFCWGGKSGLICPHAALLLCCGASVCTRGSMLTWKQAIKGFLAWYKLETKANRGNRTKLVCVFLPPALTLCSLFPPCVFFTLPCSSSWFPRSESLPSISECAFWAVSDAEVCRAHSYAV